MNQYFSIPEGATMHADLALDLKIIASVILFGGYPTEQSSHVNSLTLVLAEWAMEHPFLLTPYAEPVTSSALIFMIASRFNGQSTLELPIRFFESLDILATTHLSPDIELRCSLIDMLIANGSWRARAGPPLSWRVMQIMLPILMESEDSYPPHPNADAFRKTMQLVALQILILLAFKDFRFRKVMNQFNTEMEREKRATNSREDHEISNLVEAAAMGGASVETLNKFHGKILYFLQAHSEVPETNLSSQRQ